MSFLRRGPDAISPTAHYTGEVWRRHGLGGPELATVEGRLAFAALRPAMAVTRMAGGPTLEQLLLARHTAMDHVLDDAIASGEVGQVVELAAGMSPRGTTFAARHRGRLDYVETDLPAMARRKRRALAPSGALDARHRITPLDVLAPGALEALLAGLPAERGVAVLSEGLLNYLPRDAVLDLWARLAGALARFPAGLHLADLHVHADNAGPAEALFGAALGAFVGGGIHFHFADAGEAERALDAAGFAEAAVRRPRELPGAGEAARSAGAARVRVVVARR